MTIRCNHCFQLFDAALEMCPYCGYEEGDPAAEPFFLYPGTVLNGRYIIGQKLGSGGFGITYKAWDKNLEIIVAIKEYFYMGVAARQPGTQLVSVYAQKNQAAYHHFRERFLDEARHTAKFRSNKNIINVFEFFEANNTAYMVMEFLDGMPMNDFLKHNAMDTDQCITVMQDICAALKAVHKEKLIHRDISPDNIYLCANHTVTLYDFGAARFSKHEDQEVVKMTQVMKPGFSPPEQYQSVSKQGPWTDIYALGATLYYMITGQKPIESTNRKTKDELIPPKELKPEIPDYINDTIMRAMAVDMHLRFDSVEEFEKALLKEKRVFGVVKEKRRRTRKRLLGLGAALLVVAAGLSAFAYTLNQQRLAETLPDSTIELWYALPGSAELDQAKKQSFDEIIKTFQESFPNVTVETKSYKKESYTKAIHSAFKQDALPALFESDGLDASILSKAQSVKDAVATVDKSKTLFLKDYNEYFPQAKQFPLGFEAPAKYVNKSPHTGGKASGDARARFLAGDTPSYSGSTADFFDVQTALPARYTIEPLTGGDARCRFTVLWSIGNCDDAQLKAANRFLVFLLSNHAQDYLHIQYHSNALPLDEQTLVEAFVGTFSDFEGFFKDVRDYRFEK